MRAHLITFHGVSYLNETPVRAAGEANVSRPLRRVRMAMNVARHKKEQELVSKKGIKRGKENLAKKIAAKLKSRPPVRSLRTSPS